MARTTPSETGAPATRARARLAWIASLRARGVVPVVSWNRVFVASGMRVVHMDDPSNATADLTPEGGDAPPGVRRWFNALRYYLAMFAQQF